MPKLKENKNTLLLPYDFNPRWYQLEMFKAFDSGIRFFCLVAGRRLGKDLASFNLMIREAFRNPGVYYYFFPTYEQARKALWENDDGNGRKILDYIPGWRDPIPNTYIKRINNQSMVIELYNGSIIRMVAADKVEDSIVGTNPKGAVFSEFSVQNPMGLKLMSPVFANNKGWYIINGTPRGKNHFYNLYMRVKDNPRWFTKYLPIDEAMVYTQEQINDMTEEYTMAGMSPDEIQQEMYCSWTAGVRGAFFMDCVERARADGRIGDFINDGSPVDTFWDLGITDDTTIWFRQIQKNKIVWVDYYQASGQPTSHYAEILQEKGYRYRTHFLPHDGNQVKDTGNVIVKQRELLQKHLREVKINDDVVVASKPSLMAGVQAVRHRFPLYHFNESKCFDGIKALESYHRKWNPEKGVYSDQPVHDWSSHPCDAIRVEAITEHLSADQFDERDDTIKINNDFDVF